MNKTLKEFKEFISRGNVIDLAVGVIIGGAFGKIVSSLVNDLIMPLVSLIIGGSGVAGLFVQLGKSDVAYSSVEAAKEAGVATLNYGLFIQTVIDFLVIAMVIFLFVKAINKFRRKEAPAPAPAPRLCDYCRLAVADDATRCPHCTSELKAPDA
ncbi:MAG TPA: large conductance mechanosensitive channel protein MscL [Clostridia bacterium]|jgi:large conductance mechanosensitive channel|nr:large conductance mechanosensitive channel protein MscL [Clostridia bacterium]